jgi:hypothetical protein
VLRRRRTSVNADDLDGRRLEEDWEHALAAAGNAVETTARANVMAPPDAAAASEHLRDERKWLTGSRSSLHRLFPRRSAEPPDAN